ncbi:TPA: hypothetical protein ACPYXD_005461 [Enterobacter hormaechei subsp. xiangfangensis]|jgi:hypothetical protein
MYIRADELKVGDLVSGGEVIEIRSVGKYSLDVTIQSDTDDSEHTVRMVETEIIFVKD